MNIQKIFINNQFIKVQSGKIYLDDAVKCAKNSLKLWSQQSTYKKGQVIFSIAEELENRKTQFIDELKNYNSLNPELELTKSIDRLIHYAGWVDKINILNSYSFINITDCTGVVGCIIPSNPILLSFITQVIPAIVTGNTVITLINTSSLPILTFAQLLIDCDLPSGVINILFQDSLDDLIKHPDINLIDYLGKDQEIINKITKLPKKINIQNLESGDFFDDDKSEGLEWIKKFVESKTICFPL